MFYLWFFFFKKRVWCEDESRGGEFLFSGFDVFLKMEVREFVRDGCGIVEVG